VNDRAIAFEIDDDPPTGTVVLLSVGDVGFTEMQAPIEFM